MKKKQIGVDTSECKRVVYGAAIYDMLHASNEQHNVYHKDHTVEAGLIIKESDIIRMVKMVNPNMPEHISVRVVTEV